MEVRGSNLPASLSLDFSGCEAAATGRDNQNTAMRVFNCTPRAQGSMPLRVLTAPGAEGGNELITSPVTVQ